MNQKAEAVLISNGYSGKEHRAAQLLQEDIEPGTLILTMEDEQKLKIWEDFEHVPRVYRFTDFVGESGDIPPLYGKPLTEYGACCEMDRDAGGQTDKENKRDQGGSVMAKVKVMDHPLIQHKIGILRKEETSSKEFREMISEVAMLMCYEATRELKLADKTIRTPICETTVKELAGKKLAVVPILRAGLGMVEGMLAMIPAAKVGHIGLYRDPETLKPVEYYCKLPADSSEREVYVVDPMLATGGSAVAAITLLKEKGVKNIHFMCILAAPEGVAAMEEAHPDVDLYIGALDEKLNEHGYIVPGLGDAGDRIFGTK